MRHAPVVTRALGTVLATALALVLATVAGPAFATPDAAESGAGGLRAKLESASRGYLAAQAALEKSRQHHAALTQEITTLERQVDSVRAKAGQIVNDAYRIGSLSRMSALVVSESTGMFLDRIAVLNAISRQNGRQLGQYTGAVQRLSADRTAAESEVTSQQRRLEEMGLRKREAEQALAAVGAGQVTDGFAGSSDASAGGTSGEAGTAAATGPPAAPAPRRADGGWSAESCSVDDPTTSGCITPRMLHALQQVRGAGFTRTVSCFRVGGFGEHPKGRACDFAAGSSGFGGDATGADRAYGNGLATYCVGNAGSLGVLYVIWYRQIWMPSTGWRAYSSGNGDPSSDHTNHVHLSVT